jgi:hypothetical protein
MAKITRADAQAWLNANAGMSYYSNGKSITGADVREYLDSLELKLIVLATAVATKEEKQHG